MNENLVNIFKNYLPSFKLSSTDKFIYLIKDINFGGVMIVPNSSGMRMISCNELDDKYFGKMYSIDVLTGKTLGHIVDLGVLDYFDDISIINATLECDKALKIFNALKQDVVYASDVSYVMGLNEDERFYNDILIKKKADGAGKFIINNRAMILAPSMLPGNKSTSVDAEVYYTSGNDYYTVKFISHVKNNDVCTFMRFLCV